MSKLLITLIGWLVFLSILISSGIYVNTIYFTARSDFNGKKYTLNVKKGNSIRDVASILEKEKIIYNSGGLVFQNLFSPIDDLQVGTFDLNLPATPKDILEQINIQNSNYLREKIKNASKKSFSILIKEGQSIDEIALTMEKSGLISAKNFIETVQSPDLWKADNIAFLPPILDCVYGSIENCPKYYLEGYLYPDTYSFFQGTAPKDIVKKILSNFEKKMWLPLKGTVSNIDLYKFLTMGSVIEKETGRPITGVNSGNVDELELERKMVASVFYNRLKIGEKWGSDVTISYWSGRPICQQTFEIKNCIGTEDPSGNNKFNTYINTGYPIGPISNPQFSTINAAINPSVSDNLFFVAEKNGRTYFATDYNGHLNNITNVINLNNKYPK